MTFPKAWVGFVCLVGVGTLMYGSTYYRGSLPVLIAGLVVGLILGIVWLAKRGVIDRAALPKTGLEIPLLLFFAALLVALVLSPNPRLGFNKYGWYLLAGILLYLFVDLFERPAIRSGIRAGLLIASLPAIFAALLETYYRYSLWWASVGSTAVLPPFQLRFASIIGHSNTYMGLMNLIAPFALLGFLFSKARAARVFSAIWLVAFVFSIPFSSSRGGWLGMMAWVGILALFWLFDQGRWKRFLDFLRRHPILITSAVLAALVVGGFAALKFYQVFAGGHPTHGGGFNLNRESIWAAALAAWRSSPWFGVGFGRLGLELAGNTSAYPAYWWPPHAHSIPLQFLGEAGLAGLLALVALSLTTLILLLRKIGALQGRERLWAAASLAGLVSIVVQGVFDDFTTVPVVLIGMVVHAALILTAAGPVDRFRRLPVLAAALPGLAVVAISVHYLWGYAPHFVAAQQEPVSWQAAARAAAESARRDPAMPFYHDQAGIAYAMAWGEESNPADLENAHRYLSQALQLEPNNAVTWANLAVLDWHRGQAAAAIDAIRRAIELCPAETSFYLNYGRFLEQMGQPAEAQAQYRKALELNPRMSWHPFWSANSLRRQVAAGFEPHAAARSHWEVSKQELAAGNLNEAQFALALSELTQEAASASASLHASIEPDDAAALKRLAGALETDYWTRWDSRLAYNSLFTRRWLPSTIVPGYIRIAEDYDQLPNLVNLLDVQLSAGACDEAARTWQLLQREIHAGERLPGGFPAMPACPPDQLGGE